MNQFFIFIVYCTIVKLHFLGHPLHIWVQLKYGISAMSKVRIFVRDIFRWIPNELIGEVSKGNLYLAGALELLLDLGKFEMEMVFIIFKLFGFMIRCGTSIDIDKGILTTICEAIGKKNLILENSRFEYFDVDFHSIVWRF